MQVTTIGFDLAKSVFQVHGVDAEGKIIVTKALRRGQVLPYFSKLAPCLVGMEACSTAHHWARELTKLGHSVRLMPGAWQGRITATAGALGSDQRRARAAEGIEHDALSLRAVEDCVGDKRDGLDGRMHREVVVARFAERVGAGIRPDVGRSKNRLGQAAERLLLNLVGDAAENEIAGQALRRLHTMQPPPLSSQLEVGQRFEPRQFGRDVDRGWFHISDHASPRCDSDAIRHPAVPPTT